MINKVDLIEKMIKHLEQLQAEDFKGLLSEKMPEKFGKKPEIEMEMEAKPKGIAIEKFEIEKVDDEEMEDMPKEMMGKEGMDESEEMTDEELKELMKKFMA